MWTESVMGDGVGDRKRIVRQDQVPKTEEHNDTRADRVGTGQLRQTLMMIGEEGGKGASEMIRCLTTEVGVVNTTGADRSSRCWKKVMRHSADFQRLQQLHSAYSYSHCRSGILRWPRRIPCVAVKDTVCIRVEVSQGSADWRGCHALAAFFANVS